VIKILIPLEDRTSNADITVVFSDFDNTFAVDGVVPKKNIRALRDYLDANILNHFVLASARPKYSLVNVLDKHGMKDLVDNESISICSFNGLLSYYKGFKINDTHLPFDVVSDIAALTGLNDLVMFHSGNTSYGSIPREWSEWEKVNLHYEFKPLPKDLRNAKVYLIEVLQTNKRRLDSVVSTFNHERPGITTYSFLTPFSNPLPEKVTKVWHMLRADVDKGSILPVYMEYTGMSPENFLVLGDSINDYAALIHPGVNSVLTGIPEESLRQKLEVHDSRIYTAPGETGFADALKAFSR